MHKHSNPHKESDWCRRLRHPLLLCLLCGLTNCFSFYYSFCFLAVYIQMDCIFVCVLISC